MSSASTLPPGLRSAAYRFQAEIAWVRLKRIAAEFSAKAGFNPNQPRAPAGQPDGGPWVYAGGPQSGFGRGTVGLPVVRVQASGRGSGNRGGSGRTVFEGTPGQMARLAAAQIQFRAAFNTVRAIDPTWRPTPSLTAPGSQNIEREIALHQAWAREAKARLAEIRAGGFGGNGPPGPPPPVLGRLLPSERPFPNEIQLRPLGFRSEEDYRTFVDLGYGVLRRAGYPEAILAVRVSAATGFKYENGRPFDADSDLDLAIASKPLFEAVRDRFPGSRNRRWIGPIHLDEPIAEELGLEKLGGLTTNYHSRDPSIMVYPDLSVITRRGEYIILE